MIPRGDCGQRLIVLLAVVLLIGCADKVEVAETQVKRWADNLDRQTTETGVYVRHKGEHLPDRDPWGTPLKVAYEQGGVAETVVVSSAGPDREFDTRDDIVQQRMSANLKGVGEGIRKNAGEVAEEASAGAAKGMVKGLKEGVKEALTREKDGGLQRPAAEDAPDSESSRTASDSAEEPGARAEVRKALDEGRIRVEVEGAELSPEAEEALALFWRNLLSEAIGEVVRNGIEEVSAN